MNFPNPPQVRLAEKNHKKDQFWQILIPVLLCLLVAIGIGILTIFTSLNNPGLNQKWAQISLVFLILPLLVLGLILLIVIIFTNRLISKTRRALPPQFNKIDQLVNSINGFAQTSTNKMTTPLIAYQSTKAGFIRLLELAFHRRTSPKDRI